MRTGMATGLTPSPGSWSSPSPGCCRLEHRPHAGLGSAIFLHVGTGTATAGCVSLPGAELVRVLRWLRPADRPRISISAP